MDYWKHKKRWYIKRFDYALIRKIKKEQIEKNTKLGEFDWLDQPEEKQERAYQGTLGELSFKSYLEEYDLKEGEDFTYHMVGNKIDWLDFTLGKFKIDVKTTGRRVGASPTYMVNVNKDQHDKTVEGGFVNTYVFASYVDRHRMIQIHGYTTFKEFEVHRNLREAGFEFPNGKKATKPFYDVQIKDLSPLNQLMMLSGVYQKDIEYKYERKEVK